MSINNTTCDVQEQSPLYMAVELSEKKWKLGFALGLAQKPRLRNISARDTAALVQEIKAAKKRFGLPEDALVVSCFEAGRDGFWLHRFLVSVKVQNVVVDSSSILVNRRQRRAKTDRLDAEKLLKMLIRWRQGESGVWSVLNVPSIEDENARHLHRELETLRDEQTAHINRIKGLLAACGVTVVVDRRLPERLEGLRLWDGTPLPADLHQRLLREFERMQTANRQIRQLEEDRVRRIREGDTDPGVAMIRKLLSLKAIGVNSAWLYVREVFGWRQIRNRRELAALVGVVPSPYQSGGEDHEQGISKAGNRRVRAMCIEIAWCWLQFQPQSALSGWYQRRFGHGNRRQRRIGIVALGRKLMVALLKYLATGVPPEGAELADWREKMHYTPKLT